MNPFKYGIVVSGKDFCGRKELLKQIIGYIQSSQNMVILGERRIGKSSAVYQAAVKLKDLRLLYVDFLGIKSIDALCKRVLRAIIVMEQKTGLLDKIIKTLSYMRPSLSVDPVTSMPTVSFDAAVEMKANSITEILTLIKSLDRKKRLIVIFDEFQDILNLTDSYQALALLRSKIQFQSTIPYLFVGSIRHRMDEIFNHPDSPSFKSAIPLTVEPLPYKEFSKFLKRKFAIGNRNVEENVLQQVFAIAHNIPGDIQQLCETLWEVTSEKETISSKKLTKALELIFSREQKSYENYISLLTDIQLKCLIAVAKEGGMQVFSIAFLKSAGLNNPASVRRAITRMIQLNILFESGGECRFVNPFFRAWLLYK